jgi:hypothetical protein
MTRKLVTVPGKAGRATVADVVAFRMSAQHLTARLPADGLLAAAGACAIQNSPPGSAPLALHARVDRMTRATFDDAVGVHKTLLQTWCMRGAPFFVPTGDAAVFTTGVLPPDESAQRHLIQGVTPALDALGMSLAAAVGYVDAEIRDVLSGQRLAVNDLGAAVARRIAARLPDAQRTTWQSPGPYAAGQPLGEAVVHFCLRILTLRRVICMAPRRRNTAPFVLVNEWLGYPAPDVDPRAARAQLLRRYLRCYGPSTRADFAGWLGIQPGDTAPWWGLIEQELAPVAYAGARAWLLAEHLDLLRSPSPPRGLRLLPPHDPYTQMRDRCAILDPALHREVWKPAGQPGTVLENGRIVGVWRSRTSRQALVITVTPFGDLTAHQRNRVGDEAGHIAALRGSESVQVVFARAGVGHR